MSMQTDAKGYKNKRDAKVLADDEEVESFPEDALVQKTTSQNFIRPYILLHEDGWPNDACGKWVSMPSIKSKDECKRRARDGGFPGFSFVEEDASGQCFGEVTQTSLQITNSKEECMHRAREGGFPGFSFGKAEAFGDCFGEAIQMNQVDFNEYRHDPENPVPACGLKDKCPQGCGWSQNPYFDSYITNPEFMSEE